MGKERFTLRSAVYLILRKDNEILLSRRFNTGWMDGKYSLIAGHLDGNESVFDCMIREAKEEANIEIIREDMIPVHTMHRLSDVEYIDFYFVVKKWEGKVKIMEPDKCDALSWFPIDNLPDNLIDCVQFAILNYKNNIAFSEFGWDKNG